MCSILFLWKWFHLKTSTNNNKFQLTDVQVTRVIKQLPWIHALDLSWEDERQTTLDMGKGKKPDWEKKIWKLQVLPIKSISVSCSFSLALSSLQQSQDLGNLNLFKGDYGVCVHKGAPAPKKGLCCHLSHNVGRLKGATEKFQGKQKAPAASFQQFQKSAPEQRSCQCWFSLSALLLL